MTPALGEYSELFLIGEIMSDRFYDAPAQFVRTNILVRDQRQFQAHLPKGPAFAITDGHIPGWSVRFA